VAQLSLLDCLWRLNSISECDIKSALAIVESQKDVQFLIEQEADDAFVFKWKQEMLIFIDKLSRKAPPYAKNVFLSKNNQYCKGDCFWYKIQEHIYGAVILEVQMSEDEYYLVAITEALPGIPRRQESIVGAKVFTTAWFSVESMLSAKRLHRIGHILIKRNYWNKMGLKVNEKFVEISNYGQAQTWKHKFRAFYLPDTTLNDLL